MRGRARPSLDLPTRLVRPHRQDLVAGVSVALVLIPQSLAYAQLAGFPASRGLLAAAIPPIVAAPFASSPYLQPGPTAITALLTYGALAPLAPIGSARYIALGLVLALLVGLMRLAIGLLRAGVLAYLLSQPLLIGFVPAAAILIVVSQIPVALGLEVASQGGLRALPEVLSDASAWSLQAVAVAITVAAVLAVGRRVHPLFPGVLVAIGGAIMLSTAAGYSGPTIGDLDGAVPALPASLPLGEVGHLIVPAAVVALLGFAEASAIARTYAAMERIAWDANREFISQGVANLGAVAGGFPVGASFSRSALNRLAGARTAMSALVTGLAVLAFLPFVGVLAPLPEAALAAVVIVAVVPLIRLDRIANVARLSRPQLSITLCAFVLTLVLAPHVEWAIVTALMLSIAIHLWRELRLDVVSANRGARLEIAPEGVLWFGNARRLEDGLLEQLAAHRGARELVVRLDKLGRIDLSGAMALRTLIGDARGAGLHVSVESAPAHAARVLRQVLGEDARCTPPSGLGDAAQSSSRNDDSPARRPA